METMLMSDTITSYYTIPIKSTLRSIQRLMQMSGGAEGMRNLVDSDLPKLLKQIFDNAPKFGPRLLALGEFC
jgi:E3 ubiquitin-protein ligase HUWE1